MARRPPALEREARREWVAFAWRRRFGRMWLHVGLVANELQARRLSTQGGPL